MSGSKRKVDECLEIPASKKLKIENFVRHLVNEKHKYKASSKPARAPLEGKLSSAFLMQIENVLKENPNPSTRLEKYPEVQPLIDKDTLSDLASLDYAANLLHKLDGSNDDELKPIIKKPRSLSTDTAELQSKQIASFDPELAETLHLLAVDFTQPSLD